MATRFSENQLQKMAERLLGDLVAQGGAVLKADRSRVLAVIKDAIRSNVGQEQSLDQEARALLEVHLRQAPPGIDQQKLLLMIKKKLAEEKGIPL